MPTPVVTLSCPSCGAQVKRPKHKDRATCKYCGTELTIPDLSGKRVIERVIERVPAEPAHDPEASTVAARNPKPMLVALIIVLAFSVSAAFFFHPSSSSSATPAAEPDPPSYSPETQRELDEGNCIIACSKTCNQSDPMANANCLENCTNRCEKH